MSIKASTFLSIIKKYPLALDTFTKRAEERQMVFDNFKSNVLLKYMKYLIDRPSMINGKMCRNKKLTILKRTYYLREEQVKMGLLHELIKNYKINRAYKKISGEDPDIKSLNLGISNVNSEHLSDSVFEKDAIISGKKHGVNIEVQTSFRDDIFESKTLQVSKDEKS